MASLSVNASVSLSTDFTSHFQNYTNKEDLDSAISQLAEDLLAQAVKFSTATEIVQAACAFSMENKKRLADPNNCFKSIPNVLEQAEKMRAAMIIGFDDLQPHFHAQRLASQEFSAACASSINNEITLENSNNCLEALNAYIDQTEKTIVAEVEMIQNQKILTIMQNVEEVLIAYQQLYGTLLFDRVHVLLSDFSTKVAKLSTYIRGRQG